MGYIRSQKLRQGKRWYRQLAEMLKHFLLVPLGVMHGSQIATAHVEERCIIWRAQIEQVTKATGATFGIAVFALPVLGPIVGKVIHYMNEHPALIFISKNNKAADCSLRGGDAKVRPSTLKEEWKKMESGEEDAKTRQELEKRMSKDTSDPIIAELYLKERVVAPEWRQKTVCFLSAMKGTMLVVSLLVQSSAIFCAVSVFGIAWAQSWLIRWDNQAWADRFEHDHQVVVQDNEWKRGEGQKMHIEAGRE